MSKYGYLEVFQTVFLLSHLFFHHVYFHLHFCHVYYICMFSIVMYIVNILTLHMEVDFNDIVKILSVWTDRSEQTVQIQISLLLLIQEGQLSVTGKNMCT